MWSMYCFVGYKMLLFNPTLQKNIGNDIIYIISKPPENSAWIILFHKRIYRRTIYVYVQT